MVGPGVVGVVSCVLRVEAVIFGLKCVCGSAVCVCVSTVGGE